MATTNSGYSKITISRDLKEIYVDGIINFIPSEKVNIYLDNFSTSHIYCKCTVKTKLPEYPAVYAHVKCGGFNIGTICIINVNGYMHWGKSLCSPEDQFSKKIGREIAYKRACNDTFIDIPYEYIPVFDETFDYLVGIAERKLFGKKKFEEVKPRKEEPKYPYLAEYTLGDKVWRYKGLKVLFVGENKAIVIKNSLWTSFRVGGDADGFYEYMFRKISSEEL